MRQYQPSDRTECLACGNCKDGEPGWSRRPDAVEAVT
jgi:hypothetical protein